MMRMEHRQTLAQKQTQQLMLTQKMQQALHILQLSGLELEQYVQQELEANPFLEVTQKSEELSESPGETQSVPEAPSFDEEPFDLDSFADQWDIRRSEGRDLSFNRELFDKRQYYVDSITQGESLRAHLLTQMRIAAENDSVYAIGERIIIGDIDHKGYFTGDPAAIAVELEVSEGEVRHVLSLIKRFEPTGVGASNTAECLLLQIEAYHPEEEELKILVRDHLDALLRRQIPQIAKAMKVKPERIEELRGMLAGLNPWPGHEFESEPTQYVTPDLVVEKVDERFIARLVEDRIPVLRVNDLFHDEVRRGSVTQEEKEYIKQKMESANWLVRNIAQRQRTLLRVAQAIVEVQEAFMEKGVEHIRPLTLMDIASIVGVHESTIARTTRGKYVQTPQGLFKLKYFFSHGLSTDNGVNQSTRSIQALIKKIIDTEDKRKPLSDQQIADMIQTQEGVHIARRTVTKYREAMGILKTSMRRQY
ncbi:MAG TPA: RNA polymerase factor sigma-54 [Candidatus Hydrogenedentes bacterium]|nr:RNA polymerase factor sigma-54 [Candidatus Hydrogenedentota bacterium]